MKTYTEVSIYKVVFSYVCMLTLASQANADLEWLRRNPLDHASSDRWSQIENVAISNDGFWIAYAVDSAATDAPTIGLVQHAEDGIKFEITRPASGQFSFDSQHYICKSLPQSDGEQSLEILHLGSGEVTRYSRVHSFKLPEESGDWVACLFEKHTAPQRVRLLDSVESESYAVTEQGLEDIKDVVQLKSREPAQTQRAESIPKVAESPNGNDSPTEHEKTPGELMLLHNIKTKQAKLFPNVAEYEFTTDGRYLAFATSVQAKYTFKSHSSTNDDKIARADKQAPQSEMAMDRDGVFVIDLNKNRLQCIAHGTGEYKHLKWCRDSHQLAFLSNHETGNLKKPQYAVYYWLADKPQAVKVPSIDSTALAAPWSVSLNSRPFFSDDGRRLFFHLAPLQSMDTSQDSNDSKPNGAAVLDVWSWKDPLLQSEQLLRADKDRTRHFVSVYHLDERKTVQLENAELPEVTIDKQASSQWAISNCNVPYLQMDSWESPGYLDIYLVNLQTGERRMLIKGARGEGQLSPDGRFVTWFDPQQRQWVCMPSDSGSEPIVISRDIPHPLYDELYDEPSLPPQYGSAGWLENDRAFLVYDRFDVWMLDPTAKQKPVCLTKGVGRDKNVQLRYLALKQRTRSIPTAGFLMFSAFSVVNKQSGFYKLDWIANEPIESTHLEDENLKQTASIANLHPAIMLNENLSGLSAAAESQRVVFFRESFRSFPDIWTSTISFECITRVSNANPQQSEYRWGQAQLTQWKAPDGRSLDGILYTPDGFDPSNQYPMIVYFYERRSDQLHKYHPPSPTRKSINISFYVSRGYVVFVPDIVYRDGAPGQSAMDCVLSGVKHVFDKGFVDNKKIGVQGHSWGGYQTAYLISHSNVFACAEAGAPVSNMTSAYGGIRLGSGRSRMVQYERNQSRIGDKLWTSTESFIMNSPLFAADQINTPLLILHNDLDDAVPWQQGLELFVALRRLGKPVWLLNYNGEPHSLTKDENRRDFSIRMQQFFDHHLMDSPEPEWMAKGVPAAVKGEQLGLDLMEPLASPSKDAKATVPKIEGSND